ncbi:hypothetical protein ACFOW4_14890 [Micromonospora sp. GCM10011542]
MTHLLRTDVTTRVAVPPPHDHHLDLVGEPTTSGRNAAWCRLDVHAEAGR